MNSEIIYENPEEHNESSCEINHKKTKKSVAKDNQDEIYLNGAQLNPSPTNIESTQFKQKQDEHPQQHVPPSLAISVNGQSMQISNSTEITRTQDSIEEFFTSRAQNDVKTGIMIQYPCVTIRSQTTRNKAEIQQYDPYNPQQNSKKMFLNNSLEESKGLFFKTDKSGKSMALTNSSANTSQLGGSSCLKASVEVSFDSRGSNSSFPKVMNINQNYFSNMLENSLPQQSESFFKNNLIQQCLILFDSEKNFIKQRLPEDSISLQKSKDLFLSKSKEMKFSTYSFIPKIEEVNEDEFKMAKSYPQKPRVPSQDETANSTGSPKGNYKFQDEEINQEQKKEELVQNSEEDEVQKNDDKPEQDYEFMECDQKFRTYLNLESDIKVYKQNLAEDDLRFFEMIQVRGKNLDSQLKLGIQYMDSTNNWVPTIIDDNQNIIVVNSSIKNTQVVCVHFYDLKIITIQNLYNIFSTYGNIVKMVLIKPKTQCYIQYQQYEMATIANIHLQTFQFQNSQIDVLYSYLQDMIIDTGKFSFQEKETLEFSQKDFDQHFNFNPPTETLRVRNIQNEGWNPCFIQNHFKETGKIVQIKMLIFNSKPQKNSCLIQYKTIEQAIYTLATLKGIKFSGGLLKINFTKKTC